MRHGIPITFAGIVFVLLPIALAHFWPYAHSEYMPDDLSKYPKSYYASKNERISSWSDARLARLSNESDFDYANRMLDTVHHATYHCDPDNFQQSWFTWLSWRTGFYLIFPGDDFGVLDVKTFRCGFCHQRSYILSKVLRRGGISSAEVLGISGHVISVITIDNELYALDPDLGIGPIQVTGIDVSDGALNSEIKQRLNEAYKPIADIWGKKFTDNVVEFYITRSDNEYYNFSGLEARRIFQSILFSFERIIEVCFILSGSILISAGVAMNFLEDKSTKGLLSFINRPANFS